MEMRFDSSAGEMDKNRGGTHLGDGEGMPRHSASGHPEGERDGDGVDKSRQDDRCPEVRMDLARSAGPGSRGNPYCGEDTGQPLKRQEDDEHAIGSHIQSLLLLMKDHIG